MAADSHEMDVNIPSAATAIVAEFKDRDQADQAVEALTKAGLGTDQISLVARGAGEYDGVFKPGVLMLTVHAGGRDDQVRRILRDHEAVEVTQGTVTATGEVVDVGETTREGASR